MLALSEPSGWDLSEKGTKKTSGAKTHVVGLNIADTTVDRLVIGRGAGRLAAIGVPLQRRAGTDRHLVGGRKREERRRKEREVAGLENRIR